MRTNERGRSTIDRAIRPLLLPHFVPPVKNTPDGSNCSLRSPAWSYAVRMRERRADAALRRMLSTILVQEHFIVHFDLEIMY